MHNLLKKQILSSAEAIKHPQRGNKDYEAIDGARKAGQPFLDVLLSFLKLSNQNTDVKKLIENGGRADHRLLYDKGYNDAMNYVGNLLGD